MSNALVAVIPGALVDRIAVEYRRSAKEAWLMNKVAVACNGLCPQEAFDLVDAVVDALDEARAEGVSVTLAHLSRQSRVTATKER